MIEKIKIWIVDDHTMVADGIAANISRYPQFEVIGIYANGKDFIESIKPDTEGILLLDLDMPIMSGKEVLIFLKENKYSIKPIIITAMALDSLLDVLHLGIKGYIFKSASAEKLIIALNNIYINEYNFDVSISEKLFSPTITRNEKLKNLTKQEALVLNKIANGLSNRTISDELFISHRTVEVHKKNIMTKLDLHKTALLVKFYFENKL